MRQVLIDTGPIVALLSDRDQHHERCLSAASGLPRRLETTTCVITEASHLLRRYTNTPSRKLFKLVRNDQLRVHDLNRDDLLSIDDLLARYADQSFDLADASLMWLAEREQIDEVFTIDQQDFSIFRTTGGKALRLIG